MRKKKLLIAIVIIILILILIHPIYLRAIGNSVIVSNKLRKSDAILVLSGDNPNGDRVRDGVKLLKAKWANIIVLSGNNIAWQTNLADVMEKQALYLGVSKKDIIKVRHKADSTLEESQAIVKILKKRGISKVILVTSNFHSRRAARIISRGFNGKVEFIVYAVKDKYYYPDPSNWWKSRIQVKTLFFELVKTIWSFLEN